MTRRSRKTICLFALAIAAATVLIVDAGAASAQCATCVAPTVAYSPVVTPATTIVQPTVVETGWYPGKLLGRLFGGWRTAPAYTATYVPTTYSASYAPAAYAASYTPAPYIAAYAPVQTPLVQTSYMPVTTTPACSTCTTATPAPVVTTNYAPTTVYRPVEVAPVVQSAVIQSAPACCPLDPCGACAACTTTVTQATYVPGTTVSAPGCAACAPATTSAPTYATPPATPGAGAAAGAQATPPPSLPSDYAAPSTSQYAPGQGSTANGAAGAQNKESAGGVAPSPLPDEGEDGSGTPNTTNGAEATEPTTYWNFEAPPLIGPQNNDRTAHRPTVDIHNAVYRPAAGGANVSATSASTTVAKPVSDAGGWYSVSERD